MIEAAREAGLRRHHPADLAAARRFQTGRASFASDDIPHGYWDPAYWVVARALDAVARDFTEVRANVFEKGLEGQASVGEPRASELEAARAVREFVTRFDGRLALALLASCAFGPRPVPDEAELPEDPIDLWKLALELQVEISRVGWEAFAPEQLAELLELPGSIDPAWWESEGVAGIRLVETEPPIMSLRSLDAFNQTCSIVAADRLAWLHGDRRFTSIDDLVGPEGFAPALPADWYERHPWLEAGESSTRR